MSRERKRSYSTTEDFRFDSIMEKIGTNGSFQKTFNFLFNFLLVTATSMPYLNIILALAVPDHWCHVPGREFTNYTSEEWKHLTLPKHEDTRGRISVSKCTMYNVTPMEIISNDFEKIEIDCQFGWEYDRTWYTETAASQEDWVCEEELMVTNAFAFGRIGDVFGLFIFGQLGDLVGRRPVFYITLITLIFGRCLTAFVSYDYRLFFGAILLGSLTSTAVFQAPLIVAMEITGENLRAHIAMLQCLGWVLGMCVLPFVLWGVGHWFTFMLVTTVPCVVFLFSGRIMIESPRWLASRGRINDCIKELKVIAERNGTTVPDDAAIILGGKSRKPEAAYGMLGLFSSWRLAKNTIMLIVSWVNGALAYYVIVLNVNTLGGNPFLNFFIQGVAELPAFVLGKISSNRLGRRLTQVLGFAVATVICIPLCFLVNDPSAQIIVAVLAAFVKFCIAFIFYACNLQTLEIYPTCVRQSGLSLGAISGAAFGILGPYIIYLGTSYDARYPYIILTILMLIGAVCTSFLPETLHQKLPETLFDAQLFGADQTFFSYPKQPEKKENNLLKSF